jgi:hypothetical protein
MKSGTNWVCRLLNCHPEIDCRGEYHWETMYQAIEETVSRVAPQRQERLREVIQNEYAQLVERCLIEFARSGVKWVGDRTPTMIEPVVLPNALQVVVQRDFRDVIVSRLFHLYSRPRVTTIFERDSKMAHRLVKFQQDPWYFRDHTEELLDCEEVVRQSARDWRAHLHSDQLAIQARPDLKILVIRYEELHARFDEQVRRLFQFFSLTPPESIPVSLRPGHEQENPCGLDRKGIVGDWQNYITDRARNWINDELGDTLVRMGYASSTDW